MWLRPDGGKVFNNRSSVKAPQEETQPEIKLTAARGAETHSGDVMFL